MSFFISYWDSLVEEKKVFYFHIYVSQIERRIYKRIQRRGEQEEITTPLLWKHADKSRSIERNKIFQWFCKGIVYILNQLWFLSKFEKDLFFSVYRNCLLILHWSGRSQEYISWNISTVRKREIEQERYPSWQQRCLFTPNSFHLVRHSAVGQANINTLAGESGTEGVKQWGNEGEGSTGKERWTKIMQRNVQKEELRIKTRKMTDEYLLYILREKVKAAAGGSSFSIKRRSRVLIYCIIFMILFFFIMIIYQNFI